MINKNKNFEYFDHTADSRFRGYGKTQEERFSNTALALMNIMVDTDKLESKTEKELSVEGYDLKALLYNFLEEILVLVDSGNFLTKEIKEIKIDGFKLTCTVIGDTISDKYETYGEVKAITYNDMEITDEYCQVVVDI